MKGVLQTREDIKKIIITFYENLLVDDLVGHFFTKFKSPDVLEEHIAVLVDFWDNILFYSGTYKKNAMAPHLLLNKRHPIEKQHFERWLKLFNAAVDSHFVGDMAHTAKTRALSIATVMEIKVVEASKK